ncbi:MAG: hypothetical protein ACOCSK_00080 [Rhodothermales bacterium]
MEPNNENRSESGKATGQERRSTPTGSEDPRDTHILPEEKPALGGTVFLTVILLMLIFGFWMMMYVELLNR